MYCREYVQNFWDTKLDDEAHGYFDESNRMIVYKTVLKFLNKHIGVADTE
jgi:hypothetical protein